MLFTCKNVMFSDFTRKQMFPPRNGAERGGKRGEANAPLPLFFLLSPYYEHIMNIWYTSQFDLRIPSVLSSFLHAIWSALSSLFPRHFFCWLNLSCSKVETLRRRTDTFDQVCFLYAFLLHISKAKNCKEDTASEG